MTAQAPAWLSYAAPAIAAIALLISLATYRRAGPRVRTRARLNTESTGSDGDFIVTLRLSNHGLAAQEIVGIEWAVRSQVMLSKALTVQQEDIYKGEEFPFKLEARHTRTWELSLREPIDRAIASGEIKWQPKMGIFLFVIPAIVILVDLGTNVAEARIDFFSSLSVMRSIHKLQSASS